MPFSWAPTAVPNFGHAEQPKQAANVLGLALGAELVPVLVPVALHNIRLVVPDDFLRVRSKAPDAVPPPRKRFHLAALTPTYSLAGIQFANGRYTKKFARFLPTRHNPPIPPLLYRSLSRPRFD